MVQCKRLKTQTKRPLAKPPCAENAGKIEAHNLQAEVGDGWNGSKSQGRNGRRMGCQDLQRNGSVVDGRNFQPFILAIKFGAMDGRGV